MPTSIKMVMGKESTLSEFIYDYNSDEFIISAFYLAQVLSTSNGKLVINMDSIATRYFPELSSLKRRVTLSNAEYLKYRYNPKQMSYDVYGTTELWWLILEANELHSTFEFDLKSVVLYQTSIFDKLNRILNLESTTKDLNADTVSSDLLN